MRAGAGLLMAAILATASLTQVAQVDDAERSRCFPTFTVRGGLRSRHADSIGRDLCVEDGVVVAIMSNEPTMSDDFISPGVAVSAVMELNPGTAAAIGLCPGEKGRHRIFRSRPGRDARREERKGDASCARPGRRQPEPGAYPPGDALGGRALRGSALRHEKSPLNFEAFNGPRIGEGDRTPPDSA